jgi:5-methylcytosine-specific restriction protein A
MPNPPKKHKLKMLQPRIPTLEPRIKVLGTRTLKDKQEANGRTLALNGAAWARLRALVITEQPLCAQCEREGRITPGNEVDHIDNDASNNERSNLENLCRPCHSRKTNADMGRSVSYGCDANGMPLDPNHPWNREKSPEPQGAEPPAPSRINANRKS